MTPKFEGSTFDCVVEFIIAYDIPICQAGASWQEVENWRRQDLACCDVVRALDLMRLTLDLPPPLAAQLQGARVMAENEISLFNAKLQKVIAKLKNL